MFCVIINYVNKQIVWGQFNKTLTSQDSPTLSPVQAGRLGLYLKKTFNTAAGLPQNASSLHSLTHSSRHQWLITKSMEESISFSPASEPVLIQPGSICLKWSRWLRDPDHCDSRIINQPTCFYKIILDFGKPTRIGVEKKERRGIMSSRGNLCIEHWLHFPKRGLVQPSTTAKRDPASFLITAGLPKALFWP